MRFHAGLGIVVTIAPCIAFTFADRTQPLSNVRHAASKRKRVTLVRVSVTLRSVDHAFFVGHLSSSLTLSALYDAAVLSRSA
jgi:hypothetical protein